MSPISRQPMPPPQPSPQCLEVAYLRDGGVYVRVVGLGNQHLSVSVQGFVETAVSEGRVHCAIDLSTCTGLDSTFMGTIVMLAEMLEDAGGNLCLLNVGEANNRLLVMLGVREFIRVRERSTMEPIETMRLLPVANNQLRLRQIVSAHKSLVAIDERNRERFGHFLDAMAEELAAQTQPELPAPNVPADAFVAPTPASGAADKNRAGGQTSTPGGGFKNKPVSGFWPSSGSAFGPSFPASGLRR